MENEKNFENYVALGIDIGGTGIKGAPVDLQSINLIQKPIKLPTPQPANYMNVFSAIKKMIEHFNWKGKIGCGFPGIVKKGKIYSASNLCDDWFGVNLSDQIKEITSDKVIIINDADAAALAEMQFGAGKDYNKIGGGVVIMVTLGTGIGTALFVNGHIVPNTEFGHIELDGVIAEKKAATVIREIENLSWKEWGLRVNRYLQKIEMLLSPDLIIIGGGVSESPEKFFEYIDVKAKLVTAKMGNNAGIIGAALTVHEKELNYNGW